MRLQPGDIVVRHDQPACQGIVAVVTFSVIIFVYWHGRVPSYEHAHDLNKKAAARRRRPV